MKLPSVRWPVRATHITVCYVLEYSGDCSVVMPWWVVGEGNVVNIQCYYKQPIDT